MVFGGKKKHVLVWGLSNSRGGTEAVIATYVKQAKGVRFDFLCYDVPSNFSSLLEGENRYFVIPVKIQHPISYSRALARFMKEHGSEYDVLWCNINDVSNIDVLMYAKKYGISRRIVHMHNSNMPKKLITQVFSRLNWNKCLKAATEYWACSKGAGRFLYGDTPFRIVPNMVNAQEVSYDETKRKEIRKYYGLEHAFVVGTVGRLAPQKNQAFLIDMLPALLKQRPQTYAMVVGIGPLEESLKRKALELQVEDRVIFAGSQSDIQGYLSAFDVFAFPSLYEGLSIAFLEAQFNGLPCVISEGVGLDGVVSRSVCQISQANVQGWIDALVAAEREPNFLIEEVARTFDAANCREVAESLFL